VKKLVVCVHDRKLVVCAWLRGFWRVVPCLCVCSSSAFCLRCPFSVSPAQQCHKGAVPLHLLQSLSEQRVQ
jgi:hypothetical protein